MTSQPTLYVAGISSCSWRVIIALDYKGIEFQKVMIDWNNEETVNKLKNVNPLGQVPAMEHNGLVLTQSVAMLEYLDVAFPNKTLTPTEKRSLFLMKNICELINSGIQPMQNAAIAGLITDDSNEKLKFCNKVNTKGLDALEILLQSTSGKYCIGDEVTIADCCFMPQVYSAKNRFDVDISKYPRICQIYKNLYEIRSFQIERYTIL